MEQVVTKNEPMFTQVMSISMFYIGVIYCDMSDYAFFRPVYYVCILKPYCANQNVRKETKLST